MSVFGVVLLAAAVVLLAVAEWPSLASRLGVEIGTRRRARRRARFRVIESDPHDESDEFARSVERDLASLPTFDPHDADKRR